MARGEFGELARELSSAVAHDVGERVDFEASRLDRRIKKPDASIGHWW